MLYNEGILYKKFLLPFLTQWSIVAFDHGKLTGPGYGHTI